MKWDIRVLPFLITGALAIVDLDIFNENITKPEDCPNVQYACPYCPFGQQCVYPNSGGCDGAGIPTCQAFEGCFGIVCLMKALPCPKECPFFCEYKGPPCCPFLGQPVCKPQCQTFAPCQVTKCPDDCPDDCFYPNAPTCCPKSGQAVCRNKLGSSLTETTADDATIEDTSPTSIADSDNEPLPNTDIQEGSTITEYYEPNTYKFKNKNVHYRKNHHQRGGGYQGYRKEDNVYYGDSGRYNHGYQPKDYNDRNNDGYPDRFSREYPKYANKPVQPFNTISGNPSQWNDYGPGAAIDILPPIQFEHHPGPEAAIDYFPIPGYKPTIPETKNTYGDHNCGAVPIQDDKPTKCPYKNDEPVKYYPDRLGSHGEYPSPPGLYDPPPFHEDPIIVTVTEKVTDCAFSDLDESSLVDFNDEDTTSSEEIHMCPMFMRMCPPECPDDCVYPTNAPCPYTMQPSCPSKEGDTKADELLPDDAGALDSLLGGDLDPSSIEGQVEDLGDVETIVTEPVAVDMEIHDDVGLAFDVEPLESEEASKPPLLLLRY